MSGKIFVVPSLTEMSREFYVAVYLHELLNEYRNVKKKAKGTGTPWEVVDWRSLEVWTWHVVEECV